MKIMKDMALMTIGAGALLMYQKYSKDVMNKMNCLVHKMSKKTEEALENMM